MAQNPTKVGVNHVGVIQVIIILVFVDGWIYTNDTWLEPSGTLPDEWKTRGATRRRRWIRRIYYDPSLSL